MEYATPLRYYALVCHCSQTQTPKLPAENPLQHQEVALEVMVCYGGDYGCRFSCLLLQRVNRAFASVVQRMQARTAVQYACCVCGAYTRLRCEVCRSVYYCCQAHQKVHHPLHGATCGVLAAARAPIVWPDFRRV